MDNLFDDNKDVDNSSDKDTEDENNDDDKDNNDNDENGNNGCTTPPPNEADAMEEEEEENDNNPARITPATRNCKCKEKRRCDQELGETMNDPQNDLDDDEGLGVAPPKRSE